MLDGTTWATREEDRRPLEIALTKAMAKAVFNRALNHLNYEGELNYLKDLPLESHTEALKDRADAIDWFLNPDDGPVSLALVCQLLGYDSDLFSRAVRRHFREPA